MKKTNFIAVIFIVTGAIIIGFAFGTKYYTQYKQNNMINDYERQIKRAKLIKKSNKTGLVETKNASENDNTTIGILEIPKIKLKVTIGEGTELKTLKYAVGHFKNTAMPGNNGNFCLAGHRSYTYGQYFNRLGEINVGDEIDIETTNGNFKYKVYSTEVVLPSKVDVLDQTKDATMTLVTCTPIRIATHRLIIKAREVK